jgi:hypothetical protein
MVLKLRLPIQKVTVHWLLVWRPTSLAAHSVHLLTVVLVAGRTQCLTLWRSANRKRHVNRGEQHLTGPVGCFSSGRFKQESESEPADDSASLLGPTTIST